MMLGTLHNIVAKFHGPCAWMVGVSELTLEWVLKLGRRCETISVVSWWLMRSRVLVPHTTSSRDGGRHSKKWAPPTETDRPEGRHSGWSQRCTSCNAVQPEYKHHHWDDNRAQDHANDTEEQREWKHRERWTIPE